MRATRNEMTAAMRRKGFTPQDLDRALNRREGFLAWEEALLESLRSNASNSCTLLRCARVLGRRVACM